MPQALYFIYVAFTVSFGTGLAAPTFDADEYGRRMWWPMTGRGRTEGFPYLEHEWPPLADSAEDLCRRIAKPILDQPFPNRVVQAELTEALANIARAARLPEPERAALVDADLGTHMPDPDWRTIVKVPVPVGVAHKFDALQAAGHRCIVTAGNCMRPFANHGDVVWHSPNERPDQGDMIVMTFAGLPAIEIKVFAGYDYATDRAVMFAHQPLCLWGIKLQSITHSARVTHLWRRRGEKVIELDRGHFRDQLPDDARQAVASLKLTAIDLPIAKSIRHGLAASCHALMAEMARLPVEADHPESPSRAGSDFWPGAHRSVIPTAAEPLPALEMAAAFKRAVQM